MTSAQKCTQVFYLFAPGTAASELQVARYQSPYVASTGEIATTQRGGKVLGTRTHAVTFSEVVLAPKSLNPAAWGYNPLDAVVALGTFVAHRFHYEVKVQSSDSSHTVAANRLRPSRFNLGQDGDIECLSVAFDKHLVPFVTQNAGACGVLFGVSRGAHATANFSALAAERVGQHVGAIILEGVFGNAETLFDRRFPYAAPFIRWMFRTFMAYSPDGPQAEGLADRVPKNVPVLVVGCKADREVPLQCTLDYFDALVRAGHPKCHLLVLETAKHPEYLTHNETDARNYQQFVHAFYAHYGLPHDAELAAAGTAAFVAAAPRGTSDS